jgi:transposase
MVTGIWYIMRTGTPWRDLPKDFGPWQSVYTRFRRWTLSGLWEKLHQQIAEGAFGEIRSMDCSHVKVHADGSNPRGGQQEQCMGKTKGGMNTKIAVVVDAIGRAVGVALDKGNTADLVACRPVEVALYGKMALADKGFDCAELRQRLVNTGAHVCIPPRVGRRIQYHYSEKLYRHRHTVENFFARIKRHRRVATRYEKLAANFKAFVLLATAIDWLRFEV